MSLAEFSVKNSVLINMIMIVIFMLGIYTMIEIPKEEMPAVDFGSFIITVAYRGVSPLEIEKSIIKKIEDEISDVQNIDYMTATAVEGRATIYISMLPDADIEKAWADINTEMDKVKDLPEDALSPVILRLNMREVNEICTIALGGDFSDNALRQLADEMKDELLDLDYVSKVEIAGTRERQIWIEANIRKLSQYNIALEDIASAINMRNLNAPGGSIKVGYAELLIRTVGEFETLEEINDLYVRMDNQGRAISLGDVAVVRDTLEEAVTISKLNGEKAVTLDVFKKADGNIIAVMKDVREKSAEFAERVSGLKVSVRNDGSIRVNNSINNLGSNALMGIILVFIVLWIFIGWKNALFAAWGIPFSFLLTFFLMQHLDVTINNLSLFGLILVLGMIVDDAIIVLENIHRYHEMGHNIRDAAIMGTKEITWPVIAAVTTTIAAFAPMLTMEGTMGKFMRVFPLVVSVALLASLFESLVILPSHVADLSGNKPYNPEKKHKLHDWLVSYYRKNIKLALKHRFITMMIIIAALILAVAAIFTGMVKFEFFPRPMRKVIVLNLQAPIGTPLEKTDELAKKIEKHIFSIREKEDIDAVITTIGKYREGNSDNVDTRNANIRIDLVELDDMKFTHDEIKNSIRKYLVKLDGLYTFRFVEGRMGGAPTGNDIELRIKGENLSRLEEIGKYVIEELQRLPGTTDLETSFSEGKRELRILPKHDKLALYGINVQKIISLVGTSSYGRNVSQYRGTGMEEYDIILRVNDEQVNSLDDLQYLPLRTNSGDVIQLKDIADFEITTGFASIQHRDRKRLITINGSVTTYEENGVKKVRTSDEVTRYLKGNPVTGERGVLENFSERFPGYQIEYGGAAEEQKKTNRSLYMALLIALLLVYTILATQFRSYVQPFIVMATIPFAFIGVIFGLLVTRLPFSMNTMISVVALVGVVVNDALVLVDFVNRERANGTDRWNSLINAGAIRLRPILMTTVTTIAGFMPIILSRSSIIADWRPMAVSIAFGLAFATVLTLFVIPVIYSLVDSLFGRLHMTRFKEHKRFDDCVDCDKEKNI
ncbi:MAG: efflux RND transporter permease subunit [Candidatus Cloacimonetes bacterium]|nr:efflux RND transporter permease subunit [Candidatus Cloacimonadota bacterium]